MNEHVLKTWPVFFADVEAEAKTFEIRKNDRNFQVGDILRLAEYDPKRKAYTGRECRVVVDYTVCLDGLPGMPDGFIGMSIYTTQLDDTDKNIRISCSGCGREYHEEWGVSWRCCYCM